MTGSSSQIVSLSPHASWLTAAVSQISVNLPRHQRGRLTFKASWSCKYANLAPGALPEGEGAGGRLNCTAPRPAPPPTIFGNCQKRLICSYSGDIIAPFIDRVRIRAVIWRQWRRVRTRYKMLRRMHVEEWRVHKMANCRKGPWRAAQMLNSVITKERLARAGYPSLLGQYLRVCENL